jgi:pimeloyl-ACP methyl ester carboxylesterase
MLTLEQWGEAGPVYGPVRAERGGAGGLPGVVLVHGAEGPGAGWSHRFAAILAAHGFLALPVACGAGDLFGAGPMADVDLGVIPGAGRALAAHPRASGRVGLFGWSKGGEAALLVASLAPDPFACVAAHAPPATVTGAVDPAALRAGAGLSRAPDAPRAWAWAGHDEALAPGTPIAVERSRVPLFLSSGTADAVVPHEEALALAARAPGADLFALDGQGHGLDFDAEPLLWARLTAFLRRHLEEKS